MTTVTTLPRDATQRHGQAGEWVTLGDLVGLAVRDHRDRLGASRRAYAALRGWGRGRLARIELRSDTCPLAEVVDALAGTGFALALVHVPGDPRAPTGAERAPLIVNPSPDWWSSAGRSATLRLIRGGAVDEGPGAGDGASEASPPLAETG